MFFLVTITQLITSHISRTVDRLNGWSGRASGAGACGKACEAFSADRCLVAGFPRKVCHLERAGPVWQDICFLEERKELPKADYGRSDWINDTTLSRFMAERQLADEFWLLPKKKGESCPPKSILSNIRFSGVRNRQSYNP